MLIKGADLAKILKVKRQQIYVFASRGKLIKHESGKYDLKNKTNEEYILSKGFKISDIEKFVLSQAEKKPKKEKKSVKKPVKPEKKKEKQDKVDPVIDDKKPEIKEKKPVKVKEINENLDNLDEEGFEDITGLPSKMMEMTMFELVKKYGGQHQLEKWANILSKMMTAQKADVAIQKDRMQLIEKDFVVSQVFKFIDEFINKIFDSIDSQNEIIFSLAKSGKKEAKIKIKKMMTDNYSKLAKDAKQIITNNLNKNKDKYSQGDS